MATKSIPTKPAVQAAAPVAETQVPATEPATPPADATAPATPPAEEKKSKSIVPQRYAGRYKSGGSDPLAEFIKAQCKGEKGDFEFSKFFALCRKNGLPEDKVAHYEGQIAEKRLGSQGRARMTLRNMLATLARKNSKMIGLDGTEVPISLPKPALSGAAATQVAASQAAASAPATGGEAATSQF